MGLFLTFRALIISALALIFPLSIAFAQPVFYPSISGEIGIEIENDWTYKSDDRVTQNNDLFTKLEPTATIRITPSWSIFVHGVLEPIGAPKQFENRVFADHGFFVEDLYLEYANGSFSATMGKQNTGFGIGWDITPGIFGSDFASEGYETSERIGIFGNWTRISETFGNYKFSAGTFFQDTTVLSQSVIRGRGDTRIRDGGISNTEDFSPDYSWWVWN
jgi:hypothetical protein